MLEERVRRRHVAILAADAVGYSRLMVEYEEATLRTLNAYRRGCPAPHTQTILPFGRAVLRC
jgi:hypothetical protein